MTIVHKVFNYIGHKVRIFNTVGDIYQHGVVIVDPDTGLPIKQSSSASGPTSSFVIGQDVLDGAATAKNLPDHTLTKGVTITALPGNAAAIVIGNSPTNTLSDGTGDGYPLLPGQSVSIEVNNSNCIWVNGTTAGDGWSFIGN